MRVSPAPISTEPGSTIITSPPSSDPAVIMPRIGMSASWWNRITGAYSPRRHHCAGCVTTVPFGPIVLESRVNTW